MWITSEVAQGFALAAAIAADRGGSRALAGLSPASAAIADEAQRLAELPAEHREQRLRTWATTANAKSGTPPANANPRALSLLAGHLEPTLGRRLLAGASAPRPGFVADADLVHLLLHTWKATVP